MSLIKLAMQPLVIINKTDPNAGSSKTLNAKNVSAAVVGGTTGFALKEGIEKLPGFNKNIMSHRYGSRMGSVIGGFAGAAATYGLLNKNKKQQNQSPKFYML
jgi:hypothetical protein